jgi:hypothetical protein
VTAAAAPAAPAHAETPARAGGAPAAAGASVVRREPGPDPIGAQTTGQCACGGGCPSCLAEAGIAPKLLVGALDDPAERDADRLADAVVGRLPAVVAAMPSAAPDATIQRCGSISSASCPCHASGAAHDSVAREPTDGARHDHRLAGGGPAPPLVASALAPGGSRLEPGLRDAMETRFGADFRGVRIHTDERAAVSAQAIGARAYTHGSDIVFGRGQYAPASQTGLHTLAHELAHVVQQQGSWSARGPPPERTTLPHGFAAFGTGVREPLVRRAPMSAAEEADDCARDGTCSGEEEAGVQTMLRVGPAGDPFEQEADRVAAQVMAGSAAGAGLAAGDSLIAGPLPIGQHEVPAPYALAGGEDDDAAPIVQGPSGSPGLVVQRQSLDQETDGFGGDAVVEPPDATSDDELEPLDFTAPDALQLKRRTADVSWSDAVPAESRPGEADERDESSELTTGGVPLAAGVRAFYEHQFGRDFSAVRLHSGLDAARRNDQLDAYAFTYGHHVWLGGGQDVSAPSMVLAHELAHVIQQTRPPEVASIGGLAGGGPNGARGPPQPLGAPTVGVVQRFAPYWEPEDFNGSKTHNLLLPLIGKASKIFTEAPVPNANKTTHSLDFNNPKRGFVDFYSASNTVGLFFNGHDTPKRLSDGGVLHKLMKDGAVYTIHAARSGPAVENELLQTLVRVDKAPSTILIGDLKPSHGTIEALEGDSQLNHYAEGFKIAQEETNDYAQAHPTRVGPLGSTWSTVSVDRLQEAGPGVTGGISIPDAYDPKKKGGQTPRRLVIKQNGRTAYDPEVDVKGRLYVSKDPMTRGIWNYFWVPVKPVPSKKLPGLDALEGKVQKDLITKLLEAPLKKQRLSRFDRPASPARPRLPAWRPASRQPFRQSVPPVWVRDRQRAHVAQREAATVRRQPAATLRKDGFDYDTWEKRRAELTADWKKLAGKRERERFLGSGLAMEAQKATESNTGYTFPTRPAEKDVQAIKDYKKVDFWTGTSAKVLGLLRRVFGVAFVKVANAYIHIRQKFHERLKGRRNEFASGAGGLTGNVGKAVVRIVFKVLKLAGSLLIGKTLNYLAGSLESGIEKKTQDFFDPDKLTSLFLDDEKKEELDKRIQEVNAIRDDLENRAKQTLEEFVENTIGPYDKVLAAIDDARNVVTKVMDVVNLVRWGARVAACLSPPGWGCLWILAESVIEKFAAMAVETCWFQKKVTPLITAASFVRQLPVELANLIITAIKDNVLPTSLHDFLPAVPDASTFKLADGEVPCEEEAGGGALSAEQEAMMQLQKDLGEEKFSALTELIQKSGVPQDKPLTVDEIKKLGEAAAGVSTDGIRALAAKYPPAGEGAKVPLVDVLEEAKSKEGSTLDQQPAAEGPEYETTVVGSRTGEPPVLDASRTPEAAEGGDLIKNVTGRAYALSGHTVGATPSIYIWLFRDGQHVLTLSNVSAEVVNRTWYPDDVKREKLRVHYKVLKGIPLDPYLKGLHVRPGAIVFGYLPGWGGTAGASK